MNDGFRDFTIKNIKINALRNETIVIVAIIFCIFQLLQFQIINIPPPSCATPAFESLSGQDPMEGFSSSRPHSPCDYEFSLKLLGFTSISYIFLCFLFLCSPLRTTPVLYFMGLYFVNEEGKNPSITEALKLLLFSMHLTPLYIVLLYSYHHDFTLSMHQVFNISWISTALYASLRLYEAFQKSKHVWDEHVSELRIHFTDRKKRKLTKQIEKNDTWFYRFFYHIERSNVGLVLFFLIAGFFAFNALREGSPPPDYDKSLYQRSAPTWDNNAYFALAGLDAPKEVSDFYEYGKEEIIFLSSRFIELKTQLKIPYTHTVPTSSYSLFNPKNWNTHLNFDANGIDNWDCLYNFQAKASRSSCPSKKEVLTLIETNSTLWKRFRILSNYSSFSIPDQFIERGYTGENFINLVQLNAVYILNLQEKGHTDKAMREWMLYMHLYLEMNQSHAPIVDKTIFLILLKNHTELLETLLYNTPQITTKYGDQLLKLLDIKSVNSFSADTLVADDWRVMDPWLISHVGSAPDPKRLMFSCFNKNTQVANLPAFEFFKIRNIRLCKEEFPEEIGQLSLNALINSGNVVSNLIYSLLTPVALSGNTLIERMHHYIAKVRMISVAIELIRNNVLSENIQGYLNSMPEKYWNPITEAPFLWDKDKGTLYYPNQDDPELEPLKTFKVNLSS